MTYPATYTPAPSRPASGPQPGTLSLQRWILDLWDAADAVDDQDPTNLGICNPRDVCGNLWPNWDCSGSQHARGAAGDDGFPVDRQRWPSGHPEGTKLARWLVANHRALGIQEVIWAGKRWTNQTLEWRPYTGRSDHFDHVHWAQNSAGAAGLTVAQIEAVAPKPTPAPTPEPGPDPLEDDVFFYDYDPAPSAPGDLHLVQVVGGVQVRISGEQYGNNCRAHPNYLGVAPAEVVKRYRTKFGPVLT